MGTRRRTTEGAREMIQAALHLDGLLTEHDQALARLHALDAAIAKAPTFDLISEKLDGVRDLLLLEHSIRSYATARAKHTEGPDGRDGVDWKTARATIGVS